MTRDEELITARFPRASKYNSEWVLSAVSGGANSLLLTEWLSERLDLRPGMRVLDLGCGRAASSIFLRREFGVEVWAVDLWFSPTENFQRIRDAGVVDGVYPMRADARSLPFAAEFFDAIVSIDSFFYFGTDDLYLRSLAPYVKPGGLIGIAQAGLLKEIDEVPVYLKMWWSQDRPWCLHSSEWWHRHWKKTDIFEAIAADELPNGWVLWRQWLSLIAPGNHVEMAALEADAGEHLGYVRVVGRRSSEQMLDEPVVSIPLNYLRKNLLSE